MPKYINGGTIRTMSNSRHRPRMRGQHPWLLLAILAAGAFVLVGCSDSTDSSSSSVNPLIAYPVVNTSAGTVTSGQTSGVGAITTPIVTLPNPTTTTGHSNAPMLSNMHPGWQQAQCFSCHTDQSRIPDHNYSDTSLCYLCHGTNGVPGFGDTTPPIVKGIVANPTYSQVQINWSTDEDCISRIIVRNKEGDRFEFPVSTTYVKSHKFLFEGLVEKTAYTYEIICTDKAGNVTSTAMIGVLSFTTLEKPAEPTSTTSGTDEDDNFFYEVVAEPQTSECWITLKCRESCAYTIELQLPTGQVLPYLGNATKDQTARTRLTTETGLRPNTKYTYKISTTNIPALPGEQKVTGKLTFTTKNF